MGRLQQDSIFYLISYDIICRFDGPVVDRLFHGLPLVARLDELAAKQFYY
jgi:hypothetical protein